MSWLLPMCNVLPIDREGNDISGLRGIIKMLKGGHSVLIFPEGTRSPDGSLQPAEPGAGLLAVKGGVRVLPTRIFGSHDVWAKGTRYRPAPMRVVVGKPYWPTLPATGKPSYQDVANEMMAKIAELH
jgi:1-acyl-sn-glycerol-3-phosphate acyltransferase